MRRAALLPQRAFGVGVAAGFGCAGAPAPFSPSALTLASRQPVRPFSSGLGARKTPTIPRTPASTVPTGATPRQQQLGARQWLGQPRWASPVNALRHLSTTRPALQQKDEPKEVTAAGNKKEPAASEQKKAEADKHLEAHGFQRTERAAKAAQINMSARLSKEGVGAKGKPGMSEVWYVKFVDIFSRLWVPVAPCGSPELQGALFRAGPNAPIRKRNG
jgi:putative ABC transport system ATP-binding protein